MQPQAPRPLPQTTSAMVGGPASASCTRERRTSRGAVLSDHRQSSSRSSRRRRSSLGTPVGTGRRQPVVAPSFRSPLPVEDDVRQERRSRTPIALQPPPLSSSHHRRASLPPGAALASSPSPRHPRRGSLPHRPYQQPRRRHRSNSNSQRKERTAGATNGSAHGRRKPTPGRSSVSGHHPPIRRVSNATNRSDQDIGDSDQDVDDFVCQSPFPHAKIDVDYDEYDEFDSSSFAGLDLEHLVDDVPPVPSTPTKRYHSTRLHRTVDGSPSVRRDNGSQRRSRRISVSCHERRTLAQHQQPPPAAPFQAEVATVDDVKQYLLSSLPSDVIERVPSHMLQQIFHNSSDSSPHVPGDSDPVHNASTASSHRRISHSEHDMVDKEISIRRARTSTQATDDDIDDDGDDDEDNDINDDDDDDDDMLSVISDITSPTDTFSVDKPNHQYKAPQRKQQLSSSPASPGRHLSLPLIPTASSIPKHLRQYKRASLDHTSTSELTSTTADLTMADDIEQPPSFRSLKSSSRDISSTILGAVPEGDAVLPVNAHTAPAAAAVNDRNDRNQDDILGDDDHHTVSSVSTACRYRGSREEDGGVDLVVAKPHSFSGRTSVRTSEPYTTTPSSSLYLRSGAVVGRQNSRHASKKKVSFSTIQFRYHERIISDNPSVRNGPGIGIGWRYDASDIMDIDYWEHDHLLNVARLPRRGIDLVLSREQRESILAEWGYTERDIAETVRSILKSKQQRKQTVENLGSAALEQAMENAGRTIKHILAFHG